MTHAAQAAARPPRANLDLDAAVADAEQRYAAANPKSRARHEEAAHHMPGGNTRTVLHYSPFPLAFARGEGCRLFDLDGHAYLDFLGDHSAALYGHSDPVIREAIATAVGDGIALGGPNRYEAALAAEICRRFPSVERIRFCNSGTEANLFALGAARAHTGRDAVLVFEGAYHGGVFMFGAPHPINLPLPWLVAPYNDTAGALALLAANADRLTAVLVEPMQGAAGCIPGDPAFLAALREACTRHGILLIFDEVMTSRLSPSGLQGRLGIAPDLTTFGKYLGGGLTFGGFGGRAEIMDRFDPCRPGAIAHAGTYNNNVLTMAAGLAGLTCVLSAAALARLNGLGDSLRQRLDDLIARHGVPMQATGVGSLVGLHFTRRPVRSTADLATDGAGAARRDKLKALMHLDLLAQGIHCARRGYLSLSLPMGEAEIDRFCAAFDEVLATRADLIAEATP
ncbi:MAG: aminotransferase class III-fold pyridoxal phosphate-dependent enzyme [Rhodospirillaceae bacterium]|nr:aminotransferase class III-fold pyridoxal phosphate-dependent enzyme [Rhodospirillaceae bacterium]